MAHANDCLESTFQESPPPSSNQGQVPPKRPGLRISGSGVVQRKPEYDPVTMETFECLICIEDCQPGGGYRFEECKHEYCGPCLSGYYTDAIMNGRADDIKCPFPKCTHVVGFEEIRFLVDRDMFQKYRDFKRIAMINKDPLMRWCPNPLGCGNAFKRQDSRSQIMRCDQCKYEFCFDCSNEYHGTTSCEEFRKLQAQSNKVDMRMWMYEKFYTKACPKCNSKIQKNGGCNHMTCENCRHDFCWLCLADYDGGRHFSGFGSCRQFSHNVVMNQKMVEAMGEAVENMRSGWEKFGTGMRGLFHKKSTGDKESKNEPEEPTKSDE